MFGLSFHISDLLFQNKLLKDKVAAFESGEKYVRMQEEHKKAREADARTIKRLEAEVASAHAQVVDVRNLWFQVNEDILKEKEAELKQKDLELKKMQEALFEAQRQRDEALDKLKEKNRELYDTKVLLEESNEKQKGLIARINKNHKNSSKPSSTDPNHGKDNNGRKPTGRKPGGQPGHEHHGRKYLEPTQTFEVLAPDKYAKNPKFTPTGRYVRKQLIKLHMTTEIIEYYTMEYRNVETGQRVHGDLPHGLIDDVTYDGSVKAAAYLLTHDCNVGIRKAQTYLKEISQGRLNLSEGLICNLSKQFSKKTQEERDEIFLDLVGSPVMHSDFTFGRMNGKQTAVIICATPDGTVLYQGREKKGDEGVKGSPLEVFENTLVSDHESAIIKHGSKHQECLSHVERYGRSSVENEPELAWNKELLKWIPDNIHYWNLRDAGTVAFDEKESERRIQELREILNKGKEEYEYVPPSEYFTDGYNLNKRMYDDIESYVLFLRDPSVPPTNNLAERMGRKFKRKAHQVMSFRSQDGVNYFCDGLSIIESLRSKGQKIYNEVSDRFNGFGKRGCYLAVSEDGTVTYRYETL